jgi:SAM-dependent methyltransferase
MRWKLVCPKDKSEIYKRSDEELVCSQGHSYRVVAGIPVLLRDDVKQTIELAEASLARAQNVQDVIDQRNPELYLESIGISNEEKEIAMALARDAASAMDPVVSVLIAATNGLLYKELIGRLNDYPIPEIRLPHGEGRTLLDIGSSWGRWSIAAARKGWKVVGVDPSLGALVAAKRILERFNVDIDYICADSRYLPFADGVFDQIYSYSVIQHFSREDALATIAEIGRTLSTGGKALVQMPNIVGVRSLYNLLRRGFSEGVGFDVRYWRIPALIETFEGKVGPASISVHCYFGLGLEVSDASLMRPHTKLLLALSERLRRCSEVIPALKYMADSVYVSSVRRPRLVG